jgi:hypothetical protein
MKPQCAVTLLLCRRRIEEAIEVPARHPAAPPSPPHEGALLHRRHLGRLLLIVQIIA